MESRIETNLIPGQVFKIAPIKSSDIPDGSIARDRMTAAVGTEVVYAGYERGYAKLVAPHEPFPMVAMMEIDALARGGNGHYLIQPVGRMALIS